MPDAIVARILRLPGYGVYAWEAEAAASILRLWVRQTGEPAYVCGCGRAERDIHSWTERRGGGVPRGARAGGGGGGGGRGRGRRRGGGRPRRPLPAGRGPPPPPPPAAAGPH